MSGPGEQALEEALRRALAAGAPGVVGAVDSGRRSEVLRLARHRRHRRLQVAGGLGALAAVALAAVAVAPSLVGSTIGLRAGTTAPSGSATARHGAASGAPGAPVPSPTSASASTGMAGGTSGAGLCARVQVGQGEGTCAGRLVLAGPPKSPKSAAGIAGPSPSIQDSPGSASSATSASGPDYAAMTSPAPVATPMLGAGATGAAPGGFPLGLGVGEAMTVTLPALGGAVWHLEPVPGTGSGSRSGSPAAVVRVVSGHSGVGQPGVAVLVGVAAGEVTVVADAVEARSSASSNPPVATWTATVAVSG